MDIIIYVLRCIIMLLVSWTGVRLVGKKSIAEMTSYDLAAIMLLTTVAAEPLVYKITSKATVGVFAILLATAFLGNLSLKKFFYNIDARPTIVISEGKIIEQELKKARMNLPLLLSELRIKGYQNVSDVRYAIIEPSGKMSVIPTSQSSPVTPKEMGIPTAPVNLSFPLIIDGKIDKVNLTFLQKNEEWLLNQLKAFSVSNFDEVLLAQYDSSGQLFVNFKNKKINTPNIF
ncbi:DUF421 domain-containing protein [Clostridium brassicae]|uniref:DUF421 domain-containing protein n=1 Tax=Clostridium brassicae TaxID=2999072 RepID=A0ABT4DC76_9CLOT|nr:YetF domain-containing protein [Clostridium brassicae]MCY6959910.1 DUF421 domain-containing protein [Clostridium brassicae]